MNANNKRPEALRLAGALYDDDEVPSLEECRLAATELRRLHALSVALLDALRIVVADRDFRAFGVETFVTGPYGSYWQPDATMVSSEAISVARTAIARAEDDK